ncbi:hypothetical protein [Streptosporangium sp. NPDC049304]|uniref:hypothetical protein n=2 Tax=unclassified Streptosporangium TaxID=2632669 RepID=UPI00343A3765
MTSTKSGPRRSLRLRGLLTALGVGALIASPLPQAAAATAAPPVTPDCSWKLRVSADTVNIFFPDTAASYWVLPFTVQDRLRIKLSGEYADSRYTSFNVYKDGGGSFTFNGVGSSLPDHLIDPEPGSVNPWQQQAEPGGRYTVTVSSDAAPGQVNTLPLAPEGTAEGADGYVLLRAYLPADGDFSRVPLPSVIFERDGVSTPVPRCESTGTPTRGQMESLEGLRMDPPLAEPEPMKFARVKLDTRRVGGFPNADAAYLSATVPPPADREVVVVRGKAPRASVGSHPSPWPRTDKDVRYWSMCTNLTFPLLPVVVNNLPGGTVSYGCRSDDETTLDSTGHYTYVIGKESQRAAIERIPGVTFLPFSTTQPRAAHTVLLRNMVVDENFAEAVQNVPEDGDPASAAAVMGPYHPKVSVCSLAALASGGPQNCPPV